MKFPPHGNQPIKHPRNTSSTRSPSLRAPITALSKFFFVFFFSSATFILVLFLHSFFTIAPPPLLLIFCLPRRSVFFLFFLGSRRARTPPRLHSEILGDVPSLDKLSIYFRLLIGIAPMRYSAKFLSSSVYPYDARSPRYCLIFDNLNEPCVIIQITIICMPLFLQ